jgi:hypothetical protein
MPRVIVCDVNETLLDVGALEPDFKEVFGDARVLQARFDRPPMTLRLLIKRASLKTRNRARAEIGNPNPEMPTRNRSGNLGWQLNRFSGGTSGARRGTNGRRRR